MGLARRARRIAAAAAFGGGGLGALGVAGFGVLAAEARLARRWIGTPFGREGPGASGLYGAGPGTPIEIGMLGDSSAVGLGVERARETPGAVIAAGLAALTGRPVRLTVVAAVGAESRHLEEQVDRLLATTAVPDVAVIMVGANDVTHRVRPAVAIRALEAAVRRLREHGAEVVVGTCPDLGTIEPLAQPLRYLARRWSRQMAAAQTIAVVEAGGRTVSLGDLLGAEFASRPREMFSADRFHPSAAGYARAASALLSSVCAALDVWPQGTTQQRPDVRRGEGVDDVAHAAARAAAVPGTEVAGAEMGGATRGPRGRWAVLLRRVRPPVPGPAPLVRPETPPGPGQLGAGPQPPSPGPGQLGAGPQPPSPGPGQLGAGPQAGAERRLPGPQSAAGLEPGAGAAVDPR